MPRNKMVVFTGLSGSGKSSLAFDTIFAEGQRKYVESLSAYARQFLRQMQKPDVDEIVGLSPAISIDQKSRSNNPRSTVATITEIYDYLRVLYARIGHPHCPTCGREVRKQTNEEILESVLSIVDRARKHITVEQKKSKSGKLIDGVSKAKVRIAAPVVVGRKGEYYQLLYDMLGKGYEKAIVDGEEKSLRERIELAKNDRHDIDIVVDEIFVSEFLDDPKGARERAIGSHRACAIRERRPDTHHRSVRRFPHRLREIHVPVRRILFSGNRTASFLIQLAIRSLSRVQRPRHQIHLER